MEGMVAMVLAVCPHCPRWAALADLHLTNDAAATINRVLDGSIDVTVADDGAPDAWTSGRWSGDCWNTASSTAW